MHVHVSNKRDWMKMQNGVIKLHPYCDECGVLKNVSSDKGKKIGYFVNALSKLKKILGNRGYKISDAQIRLIMKELTENEIEDTWWMTFSKQKEIFVRITKKYIRVSQDLLESVIE